MRIKFFTKKKKEKGKSCGEFLLDSNKPSRYINIRWWGLKGEGSWNFTGEATKHLTINILERFPQNNFFFFSFFKKGRCMHGFYSQFYLSQRN